MSTRPRSAPASRSRSASARCPSRARLAKVQPKVDNGIVRLEVALQQPDHPLLRPNLARRRGHHQRAAGRHAQRSPWQRRRRDDGGHALFQVRGDLAVRRSVRLGLTNFQRTEIVEGLAEGDEIILSDMSDYAHSKEIRIR